MPSLSKGDFIMKKEEVITPKEIKVIIKQIIKEKYKQKLPNLSLVNKITGK